MNQELKSFQWKESRRIPRSQILLVFLIPLLIYATLYILGMLLLSLELFVLAIFSSLFALIGTCFTKNQIIYRVEIIGFNVHIEIKSDVYT